MDDGIEVDDGFDEDGSSLWVIVRAKDNLFGFDATIVGNMIALPKINRVPDSVEYMPGTITVRGAVIPLIDFRVYTGKISAIKEIDDFCSLMDQRLNDHLNWIKELKASVDEKKDFKLATDPHKCAFGKWYDSYRSDDRTIRNILAKFDKPHRVIHGIAEKALRCVAENKPEEAHKIIDRTSSNELQQMVELFSDIKEAVREVGRRRIAIILEIENEKMALDIDEVIAVENITNIEDAPRNESSSLGIARIGRRDKTDELVMLMEKFAF